ncbi:hypothetical protein HDC36_003419 [Xanthomonas sp. JAI131]|uniref:hypothetical protein n=1 Tax=Xanthomonas sp. JAI131 TaxID=2723067 RepID=UPI0015CB44FF|nr:hypothetical protein [Xanthomonas sp. JAI131]NYF21943.1 hypothetical protein [Xanthomonas sp. JAI131]
MEIHNRAWLRRQELARLGPPIAALEDLPGDFAGRYKEIFSNWLARSYTRIELPDDFNHALKISGLKDKVLYRLKDHSSSLHGIFLRISPAVEAKGECEDEDNEAIPLTPSEVAHATGPYALSITAVVYEDCSQETYKSIKRLLDSIDTEKLPIDKLPESQRGNRTKCSIADVAASQGLHIEGHEIARVKSWTVHDLMSTLRFTDQDYLSSATETGD